MGRRWRTLLVVSALVMAVMPVGVSQAVPVDDSLVGLVDPATGEWHLRGPDGFTTSFYFGNPGDYPMVGDWDCDGVDTPGLYRQSDGYVYLRNSNTQGNADIRFYFGNPGDVPIAGDFNADGCDTVSLYRQTEGRVYIINKLGANDGGLGAADYAYYFGNPGDKPFVGDFDGDGTDTVGLHRESTGLVYFRNTNTQGIAEFEFYFGNPGDRLIAGDWNDDGMDSPGLFRPSDATVYLRHTNTQGNADTSFGFGIPRMIPVAGEFNLAAVKVSDRTWTVSTVDAPVDWGKFASLGFGADGRAVISHGSTTAWGTYDLAITLCHDQTCMDSATRIEPWRIADHTSMATGSDRLPVWSFHDENGGQLVVGRCTDARCSSISYSVVDPLDPVPPGTPTNSGVLGATAIGANGKPIIAYMNADRFAGHWLAQCDDAACDGASRQSLIPDGGDFHRFDVEVGADGLPISAVFTSRYGPFALVAMHCADAACSTGTPIMLQSWTDDWQGWGFASVTIGTDGMPIIAYNDLTVHNAHTPNPTHDEALKVVHCNDAACSSRTTTNDRAGAIRLRVRGHRR